MKEKLLWVRRNPRVLQPAINIASNRSSQSAAPGWEAPAWGGGGLGTHKKCTFSGHTRDPPVQKPWGWSPAICILTCPSSDSVARSGLGTIALDECSSFLFNLLSSRLPSPKLFSMLLPGCPSKVLISHASPFFKTLSQFPVALGQVIHGVQSSWRTGSWLALQLISPDSPWSPPSSHTRQPMCTHRHSPPQPAHPQGFSRSDLLWVLQAHYRLLVIPGLWPLFLLKCTLSLPLPTFPAFLYVDNLFSSFQRLCWFLLISSRKLCLNTPTHASTGFF